MENVTYICNLSQEILIKNISTKQKFQELVPLLEKEAGLELAFCEIIVSRWKYLIGTDDFSTPMYKYSRKNCTFGILVQDWGSLNEECTDLIDLIFNNIS
jgi:hypothetical protein